MSVAAKARELLVNLVEVATSCPHCGGALSNPEGRYIGLDSFDPPHGRSEVTYALSKGFIERDPANPLYVRLTAYGWEHHKRKPRSDSKAAKKLEEDA